MCVLLFPFAFYVLSRCREEWRSEGEVSLLCALLSSLLGCFPELCLEELERNKCPRDSFSQGSLKKW